MVEKVKCPVCDFEVTVNPAATSETIKSLRNHIDEAKHIPPTTKFFGTQITPTQTDYNNILYGTMATELFNAVDRLTQPNTIEGVLAIAWEEEDSKVYQVGSIDHLVNDLIKPYVGKKVKITIEKFE